MRHVGDVDLPACNPFDQSAWTSASGIVLEAVDHFMGQDPEDLLFCARSRVLYMFDGEVDLLVSAGAGRIGNTGHRAENEEHVLNAGVNGGTVSTSRRQENHDGWQTGEGGLMTRYRRETRS